MVAEKETDARVDALLLLGGFAALWPVWAWCAGRFAASADEAAGLICGVLGVAFAWRRAPDAGRSVGLLPCLCFAFYALFFPHAPPLARAAIGVTAFAALVSRLRFGKRLDPGLWLLLLLMLPVMPSLQFYCGYPLRRAVASGSALLLRAQGFPVFADGAALDWAGRQISVDAPCSGMKMLWTALLLAAAVSCGSRRGWLATSATALFAVTVAVAANIWRASALFFVETTPGMPGWLHESVGLVCFAAAAGAIVAGAAGARRWTAAR